MRRMSVEGRLFLLTLEKKQGGELTFKLYPSLHTRLARLSKGIPTRELKILRDVVHLLTLQIRNNDENLIAPRIVHSAQEHQFGELYMLHRSKRLDYSNT